MFSIQLGLASLPGIESQTELVHFALFLAPAALLGAAFLAGLVWLLGAAFLAATRVAEAADQKIDSKA